MSENTVEKVQQDEPQGPITRATRVERVTLFEDRAEVVRRAVFSVKPGSNLEACAGISLFVDDGTAQAKVIRGSARVLSVRVLRRAHLEKALGREEIDALVQAAREAQERMTAADLKIERTQRMLQQHYQMSDQWIKSVAQGPKNGADSKVVSTYRDAWRAIDESANRLLEQVEKTRAERVQAERDWALAERRLKEGSIESPRYDAVVEVEIDAREGG